MIEVCGKEFEGKHIVSLKKSFRTDEIVTGSKEERDKERISTLLKNAECIQCMQ